MSQLVIPLSYSKRNMRRLYFALPILLAGLVAGAQTFSPDSLTASITRTTEKDDFHFNFKIKLPDQPDDRYTISLKACEIKNDSGISIPIGQVKLVTNGDFAEYTYFDITLTDVKLPGKYKGQILLKVLQQKKKPRDYVLPVKLSIVNGIEAEKLSDPPVVNMTNHVGFLPAKEGILIARLKIKSKGVTAKAQSVQMALHGRTSGDVLTEAHITPVTGDTLKGEMIIVIADRALTADTYSGWLNIDAEGLENPIRFDNVVVKVKHGWVLVVLTILVGLLLGRMITLFNSDEIQAYHRFMDRIWDLKERAVAINQKESVFEQLAPIERKLRLTEFDAKEIDAALDKVDSTVIELEVAFKKRIQLKNIADLSGGSMAAIEWLKQNDNDFQSAVIAGQNDLRVKGDLRARNDNSINRTLLKFTGLRMKAYARNPRFRMVMLLVSVALMAGLGFTLHYLNKPDFGELGFFDYFNVLLWSSGSTAVLKSLFSIQ